MPNDDAGADISAAELDRLYALYNGRDADGGPAGIGIQVRDRLIRRLIEQVRRTRAAMPDPRRQ